MVHTIQDPLVYSGHAIYAPRKGRKRTCRTSRRRGEFSEPFVSGRSGMLNYQCRHTCILLRAARV